MKHPLRSERQLKVTRRPCHAHHLIQLTLQDLVQIGNQSRPRIFDLAIRKPDVLYSAVLEIDERVTLVGYTSDPNFRDNAVRFSEDGSVSRPYQGNDEPPPAEDASCAAKGGEDLAPLIVKGVSGEAVAVLKRPNRDVVRADLQKLFDDGYRALAIVLIHSYTYPEHEQIVAEVAKEVGFTHVSVSSTLMPMIKVCERCP